MARVLDRLPQRRVTNPAPPKDPLPTQRTRSAGDASRARCSTDRAGWRNATLDERMAALRAQAFGSEPNGNQAGADRAAVMVGDVMRYSRLAYGLVLQIDQARGVLALNGWLTGEACEWIDRLVIAAARDMAD